MSFDWHAIGKWFYEIFSSDGAPAWVQAVGALLALWIAIKVSRTAVDHAADVKRQTIFAIAEAANVYAHTIREPLDKLVWLSNDGNYPLFQVYHPSVIEGIVRALQGAPMHELGSSKGVLAMLSLTGQMVFLGTAIEALLRGPSQHPEIAKTLASLGPDDQQMRLQVCATGFSVLRSNVRVHLDQIDKDYEALKTSLTS